MDTISRESNSSYLPIAAIIVGAIAIVLSIVALARLSSVGTDNTEAQNAQLAKIQAIEDQVRTATASAEQVSTRLTSLQRQTNDAFSKVQQAFGTINEDMVKLQELAARAPAPTPAAAGGSATRAPAVAGPDEYIVKSGDTGTKIAANNSVSLADLLAVNPGVNWSRLAVGQKLKLPKK